jgi:hypothetical protein
MAASMFTSSMSLCDLGVSKVIACRSVPALSTDDLLLLRVVCRPKEGEPEVGVADAMAWSSGTLICFLPLSVTSLPSTSEGTLKSRRKLEILDVAFDEEATLWAGDGCAEDCCKPLITVGEGPKLVTRGTLNCCNCICSITLFL